MSKEENTTKNTLDSLLHSYTMHVLSIGQMPPEQDEKSLVETARDRTQQLLSKKQGMVSQIIQLFRGEPSPA